MTDCMAAYSISHRSAIDLTYQVKKCHANLIFCKSTLKGQEFDRHVQKLKIEEASKPIISNGKFQQ